VLENAAAHNIVANTAHLLTIPISDVLFFSFAERFKAPELSLWWGFRPASSTMPYPIAKHNFMAALNPLKISRTLSDGISI